LLTLEIIQGDTFPEVDFSGCVPSTVTTGNTITTLPNPIQFCAQLRHGLYLLQIVSTYNQRYASGQGVYIQIHILCSAQIRRSWYDNLVQSMPKMQTGTDYVCEGHLRRAYPMPAMWLHERR